MIVEVDEIGWVDAVDAFRTGNRLAASLLASLDLPGAMAGSDAPGAAFASAYDEAAAVAVAAIADVARSFATLGRLTAASDATHRASEVGSIIPGAVVDVGCASAPSALYLAPSPPSLSSALGGDLPSLTPEEDWVLDHVGGFVWPDASPVALRAAAAAWARASCALDATADCCSAATAALLTQRSPEVPLAVAATDDLRGIVRDLAADCGSLAAQCAAYADVVEATHAATRALLREVLALVVEGLVVSAVLGAVTAGIGAAGGSAAVALRISQHAPRFWTLLRTLSAAASSSRTTLLTTRSALELRRARLARYLRVPVRGERGAIGPIARSTRVADLAGVRRVLGELRHGRSKPHRVVDSRADLEELFEVLSRQGRPVSLNRYSGRAVRLPDGTLVALRDHSRSGGWTLDIARPGDTRIKVHIEV